MNASWFVVLPPTYRFVVAAGTTAEEIHELRREVVLGLGLLVFLTAILVVVAMTRSGRR